jgi:hypothetical protein
VRERSRQAFPSEDAKVERPVSGAFRVVKVEHREVLTLTKRLKDFVL